MKYAIQKNEQEILLCQKQRKTSDDRLRFYFYMVRVKGLEPPRLPARS